MGAHSGNRAARRRNRHAKAQAAHKRWLGYVSTAATARVQWARLRFGTVGLVSVFSVDCKGDRAAQRAGRRWGFFEGPLCAKQSSNVLRVAAH